MLRGGAIVDATLIAVSPLTKNTAGKRDSEIPSSKKSNEWFFWADTGVVVKSGLVHAAGEIPSSVHDAKVMDHLICGRPRGVRR